MSVLGGKSRPKLKNLKPFIKVILIILRKKGKCKKNGNFFVQDSQIVQLLCKNSNEQEGMVKELEDKSGDKNFFLADPGNPILVIST